MQVTRRQMLRGASAVLCGPLLPGGYALGLEPFRLHVQTYQVSPDNWPPELSLRIVALADIHASVRGWTLSAFAISSRRPIISSQT